MSILAQGQKPALPKRILEQFRGHGPIILTIPHDYDISKSEMLADFIRLLREDSRKIVSLHFEGNNHVNDEVIRAIAPALPQALCYFTVNGGQRNNSNHITQASAPVLRDALKNHKNLLGVSLTGSNFPGLDKEICLPNRHACEKLLHKLHDERLQDWQEVDMAELHARKPALQYYLSHREYAASLNHTRPFDARIVHSRLGTLLEFSAHYSVSDSSHAL